jgi:heme exporter protein C
MKLGMRVLVASAAVLVGVHLYLALVWSPPEAQMHDLVRIMYFHVASAWTALVAFLVTFVCSILYLWRRRLLYDAVAVCSAEIGLVYTSITLLTGSLWAKPIWQTWWTWDPRLTTTLILWFLFIAYMLLRGTIATAERRAVIAAIYAIVAFADVPVIHLSVRLWRSIHPDAINDTGFHMPPAMAFTLMFGFVAFLALYLLLLLLRVQVELMRQRIHRVWQRFRDVATERGGM